MHCRAAVLIAVFLLPHGTYAWAQGVAIRKTTPTAVTDRLKVELLPQGFGLETANEKGALFTLDRGMVAQQGSSLVRGGFVHVVLELQVWFNQKAEGLVVTASETAVGDRNSPLGFRKPVQSRVERDNLQRLLDMVRADLEAVAARDSTVKRDSSDQ